MPQRAAAAALGVLRQTPPTHTCWQRSSPATHLASHVVLGNMHQYIVLHVGAVPNHHAVHVTWQDRGRRGELFGQA